jgi:FMN phosphatase YigB (HAD superfamily)
MGNRTDANSLDALAVFDLDDTLIDTTGVLVPAALAAVARAIERDVSTLNARGKHINEVLANVHDLTTAQHSAAAAAWYDAALPALSVLPGVDAMLDALTGNIHLALLTRGKAERQWAKIRACQLENRFESVRIRDIEGEGSKADDLRSLMKQFEVPPAKTAVIGDDPSDEIRHATNLGCFGILVPDTPIDSIIDRLKKARLLPSNEEAGDNTC